MRAYVVGLEKSRLQGRIHMRSAIVCALLVSASVGISACNKADSPVQTNKADSADKVQADIATAKKEAAENNAKADETRKQTEVQASQDLVKERSEATAKAADRSVAAVADAAVTETEGATKVALAKCEALEGDAQKQCKNKANAHLQAVKDRAKAAKSP